MSSLSLAEQILAEPLEARVEFLQTDKGLHRHLSILTGTPWFIWQDSPVEFCEQVLHETTWAGQRAILQSCWDYERTAVVATHAIGKTHIAARVVAWWIATHPLGAAQAVTTAPTWRQVRTLLWPHIRRLQRAHGLPGKIGLSPEWKIGDDVMAFGFSPSDHDEAAAQGIHAAYILIVIDEAGGISSTRFNGLEGIMSAGFARMLAIGNAPTDQEDSPFEERYKSASWNGIRVPAFETPNFTGEDVGPCTCVIARFRPHPLSEHLTSVQWVEEVAEDFGEDSNFYVARVKSLFPRGGSQRAIPWAYVEAAVERDAPAERSTQCGMGVDIASDGGDELTIATAEGYDVMFRAARSGEANADAMDVAGFIMRHITGDDCGWEGLIALQRRVDPSRRAQVKIDAIGIGWGVVSTLKSWASEFMWPVEIIAVQVSEAPNSSEGKRKFVNKRAEMWWNGRNLLKHVVRLQSGRQAGAERADKRTQSQLAGPRYHTTHAGKTQIESKVDMKLRGLPSPDRAEAVLLALYSEDDASPAATSGQQVAQRSIPGVRVRPGTAGPGGTGPGPGGRTFGR